MQMNDKLSALLDGDLDESEVDALLAALARDEDLRRQWGLYCQIGDQLRDEPVLSRDLTSRVMQELDAHPTLLVPAALAAARPSRWQAMLPIAASVSAVAAVAWVAFTLNAPAPAPVASVQPPVLAIQSARVVIQDDPHREYLVAHQAQAGVAPMPGVARYVRSVSDFSQDVR